MAGAPHQSSRLLIEDLVQAQGRQDIRGLPHELVLKNTSGTGLVAGQVGQVKFTASTLVDGAYREVGLPSTNVIGVPCCYAKTDIANNKSGTFVFLGDARVATGDTSAADTPMMAGVGTGLLVACTAGHVPIAFMKETAGVAVLKRVVFNGYGFPGSLLPTGAPSTSAAIFGQKITKALTPTVTVPALASGGNESEVFTVTEFGTLAATDWIEVIPPSLQAVTGGTIVPVGAQPASASTIEIHWNNSGTAGGIPTTGNYVIYRLF